VNPTTLRIAVDSHRLTAPRVGSSFAKSGLGSFAVFLGNRIRQRERVAMKNNQYSYGDHESEQLGTTLMHEHLLIGWAGWELDCAGGRSFRTERRR